MPREFQYVVEPDYNDAGDEIRSETTLHVLYNRHGFHGNASFEVTDVFALTPNARLRLNETEVKTLLGDNAYDKLEEAANEDWLEYGA